MLKAHGVERVHAVRGMKSLAVRMPDGTVFLDESLGAGSTGTALHELVHKWKREGNQKVKRIENAFQRSTAAAKRFILKLADSVESAIGNRAAAEAYADEHAAEEAAAIALDQATESGGKSALGLEKSDILAAFGGMAKQVENMARALADKAQAAKLAYLDGKAEQAAPEADATDRAYLAAVERGDMETAQRIVDEAAKRAAIDLPSAYVGVPNSLMGFRKSGQNKSYSESNFKTEIVVVITNENETFVDGMKGLNVSHAMERARRNWFGDSVKFAGVGTPDPIVRDDAGRIIPPSERFNPHMARALADKAQAAKLAYLDGKAEQAAPEADATDRAYLAAVERGDMETAQRMVDEAAMKAGYILDVDHQTNEKFTAFEAGELGFHLGKNIPDGMLGAETMRLKAAIKNPLRLDDAGAWNLNADSRKNVITQLWQQDIITDEEMSDLRSQAEFANEELQRRWGERQYDDFGYKKDLYKMTGFIRDVIKEKGYDGIVYRNEAEGYEDSYIAFDSSQLKSAAAIVRDDQGRVIPLSERFNPQSDDIRYAASRP
ncbi:MAG TPA: hypothetical protein P5540_19820, partial [Candidatus Hydrogenedentes bacterium]|nr:hypothetical protein [Candidatus Hydrogenedentota bacterium]